MLFVLVFLIWPVAELLVAIKVADAIGALYTVLLLLASWPLGVWAVRSEGRVAWRRLADAVAVGRPPGREVLDGALILLGGALMIVPGFITDAFGALLLLAPSRRLMRGLVVRNVRSRFVVRATRFGRRPYDVDSTARDLDQPRLRP
jgi:UPF0716 protein FxsA